jgi:hypothetical protein
LSKSREPRPTVRFFVLTDVHQITHCHCPA